MSFASYLTRFESKQVSCITEYNFSFCLTDAWMSVHCDFLQKMCFSASLVRFFSSGGFAVRQNQNNIPRAARKSMNFCIEYQWTDIQGSVKQIVRSYSFMQSTLVFSKRVEYYAKRIFIIYCETVSHSNVDFGRASGVYGRSRARKGEESRMQMRQIDRESESENEAPVQLSNFKTRPLSNYPLSKRGPCPIIHK